jgi:hypothetical protein
MREQLGFSFDIPAKDSSAKSQEGNRILSQAEIAERFKALGLVPPGPLSKVSKGVLPKKTAYRKSPVSELEPTEDEILAYKPGIVIRTKQSFFTQWQGRPWHVILEDQPSAISFYSYYTHPHCDFKALQSIVRPSPNAVTVIHDHSIREYCSPLSKCREIPYVP